MPTSVNVTNLKINELTEAQYDTAVQGGVIGENELSILTDVEVGQVIQVATLPTASADELDKIYQYIGTTDANYTNGYFYKCVSDGQQPATYSWSRVDVQPAGLVNNSTSNSSISIGGESNGYDNSVAIGNGSLTRGETVAIGKNAQVDSRNIAIGNMATAKTSYGGSVALGYEANADIAPAGWKASIAIGARATASASGAIQLSATKANNAMVTPTNSDANTVKISNDNGNFEMMSADGTIPSDRLIHAINKYSTMPTAASTNEGWIVQYTGTTDSTYTHGYIYECVSDGGNPATYSWTEVSMGGGGSSYTAGTGIDITNGTISVTSPTLVNQTNESGNLLVSETPTVGSNNYRNVLITSGNTTLSNWTSDLIAVVSGNFVSNNKDNSVYIGSQMQTTRSIQRGVAIGAGSGAGGTGGYLTGSICIGYGARCSATKAIQISCDGISQYTNADTNTFKIGNENGNFEIMSADGTIPTSRLTKVNSTITLAAADWSSNTQTVNVTGMTATGVVMVSPDPTDQSAYTSAGILCTAQAAGTLTFTCSSVPSSDIDVNVVML